MEGKWEKQSTNWIWNPSTIIYHYYLLYPRHLFFAFWMHSTSHRNVTKIHDGYWGNHPGGLERRRPLVYFYLFIPVENPPFFFLWMVPQYSEYSWYLEWFYFGGTPNQLKSKYQTRWFRTKGVVSHQDILQRSCIPERLDVFVGFLYRVDFWRLKSLAFAHINQGTETITMW
jgi:hypothetical protein